MVTSTSTSRNVDLPTQYPMEATNHGAGLVVHKNGTFPQTTSSWSIVEDDDRLPILGSGSENNNSNSNKFRSARSSLPSLAAYYPRITTPTNFVSHVSQLTAAHGTGTGSFPRATLDSMSQKAAHWTRNFSPSSLFFSNRHNRKSFTRLDDKFPHARTTLHNSVSRLDSDDEGMYLNGWTRSKWILITTIIVVSSPLLFYLA